MQPTRTYQFETTGCQTNNWFYPTTYEQQQKYQQLMGGRGDGVYLPFPCYPGGQQQQHQQQFQPSFDWQQQQQFWNQQQWFQQQQQQQWWFQQQQRFQQQQQYGWWNNVCCWTGCRPSNPLELQCLTSPIRVLDREGNRMIWLCFDQRGFRPEEINVTLNRSERCITIECVCDSKEGRDQIQRRFCRRFCLPEQLQKCDLSKCELQCYLNPEGQLTIECTLPRMTQEELVRYCQTNWQQQQCMTPVQCKTN